MGQYYNEGMMHGKVYFAVWSIQFPTVYYHIAVLKVNTNSMTTCETQYHINLCISSLDI